jgi:hypothetical protein
MQVQMKNAKAVLAESEPKPEPFVTVRTHAELFFTAYAR